MSLEPRIYDIQGSVSQKRVLTLDMSLIICWFVQTDSDLCRVHMPERRFWRWSKKLVHLLTQRSVAHKSLNKMLSIRHSIWEQLIRSKYSAQVRTQAFTQKVIYQGSCGRKLFFHGMNKKWWKAWLLPGHSSFLLFHDLDEPNPSQYCVLNK